MSIKLISLEVRYEHDAVLTRQRARQIATLLGFDVLDQTRISTAVSELARNILGHAEHGRVDFMIERTGNPSLIIRVSDDGPGIGDLRAVLDGKSGAEGSLGFGLAASKRLMDLFHIESNSSDGTTIVLGKFLPKSVLDHVPERISNVVQELSKRTPQNPFEEIQYQNQELMTLMDDLRMRQDELQRLNQELAETNRGVVALYSELDDQAGELQRASELKSNFLSNMSHEFRTPLASIMSLSDILLGRLDGDLSDEQVKQVHFIKASAESLMTLVNDLLDMAKIEAGKTDVYPNAFSVSDLFTPLQATFGPLLRSSDVKLVMDYPVEIPMLYTDQTKLMQILRNFIANAVKFTERGTIAVTASPSGARGVEFSVVDTGIGIASEHQELIFVEFAQVPQNLVKPKVGTGLGLPLCRKLANLLGGDVAVRSELGVGSAFSVTLPIVYSGTFGTERGS